MYRLTEKMRSINPWHFLWIAVVLSELFTVVATTIQSYLWWGFLSTDVLCIGAIDAFFVPLVVAPIIIYIDWERKHEESKLTKSKQMLESITQGVTEGIMLLSKDFKILWANKAAIQQTGLSMEELVGSYCYKVARAGEQPRESPCDDPCPVRELLKTGCPAVEDHTRYDKSGNKFFVEVSAYPVKDESGEIVSFVHISRNITERKQFEEKLVLDATVFANTSEGIMITDSDALIRSVNKAFEEITGYSAGEVIGLNPRILKSGRHDDTFYKEFWISLLENGQWKGIFWNRRKNGELYPQETSINSVKDENGNTVKFVAIFTDITVRQAAEDMMLHLSTIDGLTGLSNRHFLDEMLDKEWKRARRNKYPISIMMIDLDFFKNYNDTYGHLKGDECLKSVADVLKGTARRPGDVVARFGGEEFVVALAMTDTIDAVSIAEKIRMEVEALKIPHERSKISGYVTLSIGVVSAIPNQNMSSMDLTKYADEALYKAKEEGRNRVVFKEL